MLVAAVARSLRRVGLVLALAQLATGCSTTSPAQQATALGFNSISVPGTEFTHRAFTPSDDRTAEQPVVVLLIDGDGVAFASRTRVSLDPTPNHSQLVGLMPQLSELAPTLYLGRPCYHAVAQQDEDCHLRYWTTARYSSAVINSLTAAVGRLVTATQQVLLVGYSGGGVLALLVADQLGPQAVGVVTFGAPLDTTAWTAFHGFTPLTESQNPAAARARLSSICQLHLFGSEDAMVPPALRSTWAWPKIATQSVSGGNHRSGWQAALVRAIGQQLLACTGVRMSRESLQ